tara:strand:- start:8041 stop:9150 length:1110 start_codon:yes stop_codon:yes gene_type:complete
MTDIVALILFVLSGAASGWLGVDLTPVELLQQVTNIEGLRIVLAIIGSFIGLAAGFVFLQLRKTFLEQIKTMPTDLLISRSVGLILGLLVANLLLAPILLIPLPRELFFSKPLAAILSNVFFGVLGYKLADTHGRTLLRLFNPNTTDAYLVNEGILPPASAKILDTSVIIDGRISGLLNCGLLEGQIIVSQPVIDELQKLADSSSNEKRSKGRRGLKLLRELREKYGRRLVVNSTKYEGSETDEKLLKLTNDVGGTLLTADYNLSQIAEVKELKVLNLSDLVIALRPEVQPGESLNIKIVREGKEQTQGIGYLDDGTMVVVEGAKEFVGNRMDVVITGALQTPTGRMIFGKPGYDKLEQKTTRGKANNG